jgi:hypothetical protein
VAGSQRHSRSDVHDPADDKNSAGYSVLAVSLSTSIRNQAVLTGYNNNGHGRMIASATKTSLDGTEVLEQRA